MSFYVDIGEQKTKASGQRRQKAPCLTLHYNVRNKVRRLPSGHTWDVKCPIKV